MAVGVPVVVSSTGQPIVVSGVAPGTPIAIVVASATAFTVASSGTSYALQVDTSAASAVVGVKITQGAAGAGVIVAAIGGNTNEALQLDGKGSGLVKIAWGSTGGANVSGPLVVSGPLSLAGGAAVISNYKNIATAGWGVPAINGYGRTVGAVATVVSVATYTVGAADGSFIVSANALVTTSVAHSFTVECAYVDEGGNNRVLTFNFTLVAGTFVTLVSNANGAAPLPYEGVPMHIRAKATNAITIRTQAAGTYTNVQFNVEGLIQQVA